MDVAGVLKKEANMYQHESYDLYFQRKHKFPLQQELVIERGKLDEEREKSRKLQLENDKLLLEIEKLRKTKNCKCGAASSTAKKDSSKRQPSQDLSQSSRSSYDDVTDLSELQCKIILHKPPPEYGVAETAVLASVPARTMISSATAGTASWIQAQMMSQAQIPLGLRFPEQTPRKDDLELNQLGKRDLARVATTSSAQKKPKQGTMTVAEKDGACHLRNIVDLVGLAFAIENGTKTEELFKERVRRFHDKLRNASNDELPPRVGTTWQWKREDLKKVITFVERNLDELLRHTVSFFGCAGPEGVHICYHSSLKPPLIHTNDPTMRMILFSHDSIRTSFSASNGMDHIVRQIRTAPFGRWYFIGGKLPSDWQNLRNCLKEEEFQVPEGDFSYIIVIGCKGSPDVKVVQLGTDEVLVALHDLTVRKCERTIRRICGNCQNPIYPAVKQETPAS
eukprot:GEMP01040459.1.p1 GENE.GEMP01040459.1~~GEMP01040459.1.p1  ORF type:complete len:452 (+),score=111.34 GEMP01040459.1:405-1760(+)